MLIKKRYFLVSVVMLLVLLISGCSSSSKSASHADSATAKSTAQYGAADGTQSSATSSAAPDATTVKNADTQNSSNSSKIVKTATIQMETLKFDATTTSIQNKCTELGGYIESSNISGTSLDELSKTQYRTASLKLRIPKDKYSIFMNSFGNLGNVTNKQETGENITEQYFDTDAHVSSLKVQESRLLELLKKSGDLTSILNIEKELQNVRYQIETLTTSLKKMDNMVDYTTFNMNITEVQKVTEKSIDPATLSGKIAKSFNNSIKFLITIAKSFIILIAYILPFAVLISLLFLIWFFSKKFINKYFHKNNEK